jgi:hypothetical protein
LPSFVNFITCCRPWSTIHTCFSGSYGLILSSHGDRARVRLEKDGKAR